MEFSWQLFWWVVASERPVVNSEPSSVLSLFLFLTCSLSLFLFPPFCLLPCSKNCKWFSILLPRGSVAMCLFVLNFNWHRALHIITHRDHFHNSPQSCLTLHGLHMVRHTHASHYSWRLHCCYTRQFHVCENEIYEIHYILVFFILLSISFRFNVCT